MAGEALDGFPAERGEAFCGVACECGLVAFAPVRLRREVGRVRLYHERTGWAFDHDLADVGGVLEGGDTAKGEHATEIKDLAGVFPRAYETMEHGANRLMMAAINLQRLVEGSASGAVAGMNDHVEAGGLRDFKMRVEQIALAFAEGILLPAFGSGVKIIEAGFSDAAYARIAEMSGDPVGCIIRRVMNVAGMDPKARVNRGIGCGIQVRLEIGEARRKRDEPADSGDAGGFDQTWNLTRLVAV